MTPADLLKSTRQYFWNLHFDEVEIEYLNSSLPLEPNIYSFKTEWTHTQETYYLPTSPEMGLKKHLATTQDNCFSIAHCFRDLEAEGPTHTKEFLMLEWYEVGKTYLDLIESTKNYISQFYKTNYSTLHLPPDLPDNEPDFNQFFLNEIEPTLPKDGAVFITGYPAFLSPLAAIEERNEAMSFSKHSHPRCTTEGCEHRKKILPSMSVSQRFELYINGIEIANGCTENRDPSAVKLAFENENEFRQKHHLPSHPYSLEFLNYLSSLPPAAGIGLGIDRLVMLISTK